MPLSAHPAQDTLTQLHISGSPHRRPDPRVPSHPRRPLPSQEGPLPSQEASLADSALPYAAANTRPSAQFLHPQRDAIWLAGPQILYVGPQGSCVHPTKCRPRGELHLRCHLCGLPSWMWLCAEGTPGPRYSPPTQLIGVPANPLLLSMFSKPRAVHMPDSYQLPE